MNEIIITEEEQKRLLPLVKILAIELFIIDVILIIELFPKF